jgi:transglutaminase-like putative cysteine protease
MIERARTTPDEDGDGFADWAVWLETTLAGAGRLGADLTPGCAAALRTVLDALSEKSGPEDTRSLSQRHRDALEEACRRLFRARLGLGQVACLV